MFYFNHSMHYHAVLKVKVCSEQVLSNVCYGLYQFLIHNWLIVGPSSSTSLELVQDWCGAGAATDSWQVVFVLPLWSSATIAEHVLFNMI